MYQLTLLEVTRARMIYTGLGIFNILALFFSEMTELFLVFFFQKGEFLYD